MLRRALATVALLAIAAISFAAPSNGTRTRVLDPYPVTIHYEPRYSRVAERVDAVARDNLPRLMAELGLTQLSPIDIVVTAHARDYDASLAGELPNWGVAFAILEEQRILVDVQKATRAYNSLDEVVPHELSHLLVRQKVPHARLPIWFSEGLAQWQAREWSLVDAWELMQGVWAGSAPRIEDLYREYPSEETRAQSAYRISYAAFTDLFSGLGFQVLPDLLATVEQKGSFSEGFFTFFGFSTADYAAYFHDEIERRYKTKALVFQSGPLFGFAALVFVAMIVRYTIRRRRKYQQLEE